MNEKQQPSWNQDILFKQMELKNVVLIAEKTALEEVTETVKATGLPAHLLLNEIVSLADKRTEELLDSLQVEEPYEPTVFDIVMNMRLQEDA
jgi:hypothetical protein